MNTKAKTIAPKIPWKKIKSEFLKKDHIPCLCWGSETFKEIWSEEVKREYIRGLAADFLKGNSIFSKFEVSKESDGYGKSIGLFEHLDSEFSYSENNELRIKFLDYCIERFAPIPWKKIYEEYISVNLKIPFICHRSKTFESIWTDKEKREIVKRKSVAYLKKIKNPIYISPEGIGADVVLFSRDKNNPKSREVTYFDMVEFRREFLEYCATPKSKSLKNKCGNLIK